ncbi:CoA transferase [Amycolatopsis rhabdoformis]|uniref:CoA transferase n=1 Tax=Amycolatopsis rhabdoformis TaxID=1448059 RepID=A0ABZ1IC45_9PSEU|nr:CoA transferase [Amycolatopsis rhabdoformis]WSE31015.1 CoA transferase [Amycolatopsis rhabdoformis]
MQDVLAGVWHTLTGEPLPAVSLNGAESVLPGTFRVEAAATAGVAAATLAAAELLRLRGIDPGTVSADARHAAASVLSERLLRVDGAPAPDVWGPLSGDYRACDGWVRLHANYRRHEAAVCWSLGVPAKLDAVTKTVAAKTAAEVESAVVTAGGAAAVMRSREEWLAHPQGQAVAGLPIAEIRQVGEAPKNTLFDSDRPLGGVRVLELTHVLAGPVAGRVLAAHGANVLHVGAAHLPRIPALTMDTGQGKRSAFVALDTEGGRAKLKKLIARADVVLQSFRPGALARIGFGPEDMAELRPGLVTADLSAYGWAGPWARRRGFDSLVQMASGIAEEGARMTGADHPVPLPAQALDHTTGWLAAAAIMTAVRRSVVEGGSWNVRLSLAGTGRWLDSLGRKEPVASTADFDDLLEDVDSGFGKLTRVRMAGGLPGAPPRWDHASHLPGSDSAVWHPVGTPDPATVPTGA